MIKSIAKCSVSYNDDKITINGLTKAIDINCSADINITPLVEELVIALESYDITEFEFQGFDETNKKHGIIKKAISGVFEAFNEISSSTTQQEGDLL